MGSLGAAFGPLVTGTVSDFLVSQILIAFCMFSFHRDGTVHFMF